MGERYALRHCRLGGIEGAASIKDSPTKNVEMDLLLERFEGNTFDEFAMDTPVVCWRFQQVHPEESEHESHNKS